MGLVQQPARPTLRAQGGGPPVNGTQGVNVAVGLQGGAALAGALVRHEAVSQSSAFCCPGGRCTQATLVQRFWGVPGDAGAQAQCCLPI